MHARKTHGNPLEVGLTGFTRFFTFPKPRLHSNISQIPGNREMISDALTGTMFAKLRKRLVGKCPDSQAFSVVFAVPP